MAEPAQQIAAGWYADPWEHAPMRWWDGAAWTGNVSSAPDPQGQDAAATVTPIQPAVQTKHQLRRREGAELFTAGPGPFTNEVVARHRILNEMRSVHWVATAALLIIGALMIWHGWDVITNGQSMGYSPRRTGKVGAGWIIAGLVAPLVPYAYVASTLGAHVWERWVDARGLGEVMNGRGELDRRLPLFTLGTKRSLSSVMRGELGGQQVELGSYSYSYDKDQLPLLRMATAAEQASGSWWIVRFTLPAQVAGRYPGLSVMRASGAWPVEDDAFEVQLESIQLQKALTVYGAPGQDPVAVHELLGPQLLAELMDSPLYWEQRGSTLVVCFDGNDGSGAYRDHACASALLIYEHYLTETR